MNRCDRRLNRVGPDPLRCESLLDELLAFGDQVAIPMTAVLILEKIKGRPGRKLSDKVVRKVLKTSLSSLEDEVDAYARARSSL